MPGSAIASPGSQVKPMVSAYLGQRNVRMEDISDRIGYLVPPVTGSTMCLFSGPEVNADTRPSFGSIDRFSFDPSSRNMNLIMANR